MALTRHLFHLVLLSLLVFASANYDYQSTGQNPNIDPTKSQLLGQDHREPEEDNLLGSTLKGLNLDVLNPNKKDYEQHQKLKGQVSFVSTESNYKKPEPEPISYKKSKAEGQEHTTSSEPINYKKSESESYKKPEPEGYRKPEPESYKKPEPEKYTKSEPERYKKSEPESYKKSEPEDYKKPEPESYKKSEPESYKKSELESYKKPVSEGYKKPEPEGYKKLELGQLTTRNQRAEARIRCQSSYDQKGYSNDYFSIVSPKTNNKGYFFATFPASKLNDKSINIQECKAFLEYSPLEKCNVATGSGRTGAYLSLVPTETDKISYNVGSLIYTPKNQYYNTVPNNSGSNYPYVPPPSRY
ncbi:hypothetical protein L484_003348 [Morus notabilis]|uniref:Uncharacterized protein n=1 Tax=Morus notabilis TaxID=981085 RepID=W9RAB6_9ROSA|nr:hypothetical protein L484_003348 [Morus notabilis]